MGGVGVSWCFKPSQPQGITSGLKRCGNETIYVPKIINVSLNINTLGEYDRCLCLAVLQNTNE